jgi:hypothetical protein
MVAEKNISGLQNVGFSHHIKLSLRMDEAIAVDIFRKLATSDLRQLRWVDS